MASKLFRKGPVVSDSKKGLYVSIKDEESVALASLVNLGEMLSADVHEFWEVNPFVTFPCLGKDCPACKIDAPTRFKAYLPIVTREGEVKIFAFGIRVANQLTDIEAAVGDLRGKVLRIKRTGKGLKTQYTVVPTGHTIDIEDHDIPDIEGSFGDISLEGVTQTMIERGLIDDPADSSGELIESRRKPAVVEVDDDDDEAEEAPRKRRGKKDAWDGI